MSSKFLKMLKKNSKKPSPKPYKNSSVIQKSKRKPSKAPYRTIAKNSPKSAKPAGYHRRTVSESIPLVQLKGKVIEKAPKLFNNQIFRDVYDELGNHDRVLDTVQSIEVYEEVNKGTFITFNNKSDGPTEKFIQPDTSYKSVEDTNKGFTDEIFAKLQKLAVNKRSEQRLDRIVTIEKHRYMKNSAFVFPAIFD